MIDLTQDYSEHTVMLSLAGSYAIRFKLKELNIHSSQAPTEFILAVLRLYTRTIASAYTSAKNRDAIEVAIQTIMTATHQRIFDEIADIYARESKEN